MVLDPPCHTRNEMSTECMGSIWNVRVTIARDIPCLTSKYEWNVGRPQDCFGYGVLSDDNTHEVCCTHYRQKNETTDIGHLNYIKMSQCFTTSSRLTRSFTIKSQNVKQRFYDLKKGSVEVDVHCYMHLYGPRHQLDDSVVRQITDILFDRMSVEARKWWIDNFN